MKIETTYSLGDIVYRKNDPDQREFIITGVFLRPEHSVSYYMTNGEGAEVVAYSCEICDEKDVMKTTTN